MAPIVAPSAAPIPRAQLWTAGFVLVCLANMLGYGSNLLLSPIMPLYVESLGGTPFVAGLMISAFSVLSFILRPLMGHLTDRWSVRGTLGLGSGIIGVLGLAFLVPGLLVAFPANAIRGIGWGALNTAGSAAAALLVPQSRRAEGSGYYLASSTIASAFAPAIALWLLAGTGQFSHIFILAGALGIGGAAATLRLPRAGAGSTSLWDALKPRGRLSLESFVERRVLLCSALVMAVTATTPALSAFIPTYAFSLGVENIGLYYIVAGLSSISSRLVLGRWVDRGSRGVWLLGGYGSLIVGFAILANTSSLQGFLLAAIATGLGQSLVQTSLMALAIDLSEKARMGKAMATFSMFYRLGEGIGAPIAGALIQGFGFQAMYYGAIVSILGGVAYAAYNWRVVGRGPEPR
ncbi:MAG: transporter [Chloroflexi bacterium]|nr:transporter [Chloroflexota bacterium]